MCVCACVRCLSLRASMVYACVAVGVVAGIRARGFNCTRAARCRRIRWRTCGYLGIFPTECGVLSLCAMKVLRDFFDW